MVKRFSLYAFLAFVLLITYVPILILVVYSFTDTTLIGQWNGFSLALYRKLFSDARIMGIVKDTLVLAVLASTIATLLGTMGSIGIFYSRKRTARIVGGVSNIPLINAEIVTAVSLALIFALVFGQKTFFALVAGHVVICVPFVVVSIIPKLKQMDNSLYEAALDLGATPTKALFTVVLPEILPGIAAGFMLSITLSLDDYIVTAFIKPDTFDTISTYVYNAVKNPARSSLPALRALSTIIFVIMLGIVTFASLRKTKGQGVTAK